MSKFISELKLWADAWPVAIYLLIMWGITLMAIVKILLNVIQLLILPVLAYVWAKLVKFIFALIY
jgi:hypothetical protein